MTYAASFGLCCNGLYCLVWRMTYIFYFENAYEPTLNYGVVSVGMRLADKKNGICH